MRRLSRVVLIALAAVLGASRPQPAFRVLAFHTETHDLAHVSFDREADRWFPAMAAAHHFEVDTTSDWNDLDPKVLRRLTTETGGQYLEAANVA